MTFNDLGLAVQILEERGLLWVHTGGAGGHDGRVLVEDVADVEVGLPDHELDLVGVEELVGREVDGVGDGVAPEVGAWGSEWEMDGAGWKERERERVNE